MIEDEIKALKDIAEFHKKKVTTVTKNISTAGEGETSFPLFLFLRHLTEHTHLSPGNKVLTDFNPYLINDNPKLDELFCVGLNKDDMDKLMLVSTGKNNNFECRVYQVIKPLVMSKLSTWQEPYLDLLRSSAKMTIRRKEAARKAKNYGLDPAIKDWFIENWGTWDT